MTVKVEMVKALIPPEVAGGFSKQAVNAVLADVADAARAHWITLASKIDSSFRNDYIQGIQPVQMLPGVAVIMLVGAVPHILEDGSPQVDLRTLLLGPNVPVAPLGQKGKRLAKPRKSDKGPQYYRAIPFRHTSPGTTKQVGQPMGSAYSGHQAVADAQKLGKQVYGSAKLLAPTVGKPYGKTNWGERLSTAGMGIPLLKPHHKTDIYSGMYRMQKTYEAATQNYYMTFRTISTRVTEGWIRKAIPARHLAQQVAAYVQKIAPAAFQAFYQQQGAS